MSVHDFRVVVSWDECCRDLSTVTLRAKVRDPLLRIMTVHRERVGGVPHVVTLGGAPVCADGPAANGRGADGGAP